MTALPLQLVDSFLLNYNVGDALLVIFGLGLLSMLVIRSGKLLLIHFILFGLLFFLTPSSLFAVNPGGSHFFGSNLSYKLLGLALLVISPVLYTTMTGNRSSA